MASKEVFQLPIDRSGEYLSHEKSAASMDGVLLACATGEGDASQGRRELAAMERESGSEGR